MFKMTVAVAVLALSMSACVTAPALYPVPREYASQCVGICNELGMQMGAMVVIRNSAGCVCEPRHGGGQSQTPSQPQSEVTGKRGGAVAAGAAAIAADDQAAASAAAASHGR